MIELCSGCQELTHLPTIIQHAKNISVELETGWSIELTSRNGPKHQIHYFGCTEKVSYIFSYCYLSPTLLGGYG